MGNKLSHLFHEMPLVGEVNNRYFSDIEGMNDSTYGRTRDSVGVYAIEIKEKPRVLKAGKIIKDLMFKDYPDFTLNAIATSAYVDICGKSEYPNPKSHWYNVMYGFYEIDVPVSSVKSAYGFDTKGNVVPKDIIKIGLCDWNITTGYLYGVPLEICKKNVKFTGNEKLRVVNESIKIGSMTYKEVEFSDIIATSVYPAREQLEKTVLSEFLQHSWGTHPYVYGFEQAFPKVRMAGRFYITQSISHSDEYDCQCYKTIVGGGVINMDYPDKEFNQGFLDRQMEQIRRSIVINEKL